MFYRGFNVLTFFFALFYDNVTRNFLFNTYNVYSILKIGRNRFNVKKIFLILAINFKNISKKCIYIYIQSIVLCEEIVFFLWSN